MQNSIPNSPDFYKEQQALGFVYLVQLGNCNYLQRATKKDINGLIQVFQVPLDAPQVVPELISGPVDFFSCGDGGILQELCPPLEEPLGSVHSFLHLPAARVKSRITISCPAVVTLGQPRVQLSRDATASSQTSFLPTTWCLFYKIRICPVSCCSTKLLMKGPTSSGEVAECHPGKPGQRV